MVESRDILRQGRYSNANRERCRRCSTAVADKLDNVRYVAGYRLHLFFAAAEADLGALASPIGGSEEGG